MRCPACRALNPESADWCTQCYASLKAPPPPPPPPAPERTSAPPAEASPLPGLTPHATAGAQTAPADTPVGTETADGRFRRTEDGLDWRCGVCSEWNPLEVQTCVVCGASFGRAVGAEEEATLEPIDETTWTVLSALLPGIGHVQAGRAVAGYLRMGLYVTLMLGGFALVRAASAAGQTILPAIPLLVGALVVLGGSVLETQRLARQDDTPILGGRFILWLVVGVLGSLMAAFLVTTLNATSGAG